jgi:hypothetical protein
VRFAASSDYKVPASIEKARLGDVAGPFCFEAVFRGLLVQFEPVTEMQKMKITARRQSEPWLSLKENEREQSRLHAKT